MFEYFENRVLCVHGGWLIESGILTKGNYITASKRKYFNTLQTYK